MWGSQSWLMPRTIRKGINAVRERGAGTGDRAQQFCISLDIWKFLSYSLVDGSLVSPPAVDGSGVAVAADKTDVLTMFMKLLPIEVFLAALKDAKVRENNRVYNSAVVLWLMICQRLQEQGTLENAVLELLGGLPSDFWPQPCKRLEQAAEEGGARLSKQTGAYNKARQELSLPV